MERTRNESIVSILPNLKDEADEFVKKTTLKDLKTHLEKLRKERRWSPSSRGGNPSKMESLLRESIFFILPRLKDEADENVKKTALKRLKTRLEKMRKTGDDANLHKLRTEELMDGKNCMERWLASERGKGRTELTTGDIKILENFQMGMRNELAREPTMVDVEHKVAMEMIEIIEAHNAKLLNSKDESIISALEEFEALKTSLGRASLERTSRLEALKKFDELFREVGEWTTEQLRLRQTTEGEASPSTSTQAGTRRGRQHRRRAVKASFDKASNLRESLPNERRMAEKIMKLDPMEGTSRAPSSGGGNPSKIMVSQGQHAAIGNSNQHSLGDAGMQGKPVVTKEGIAQAVQQESMYDTVTRLKTETDTTAKKAGLKNFIATLQRLRKLCDSFRDELKLQTEKLVVEESGLEKQLAVLRGKGCGTHKRANLKIFEAYLVAMGRRNEVANDIAIFSMKYRSGKDLLQGLETLSSKVQDFQDESFIPVLEELEVLMSAARAALADQITHFKASKMLVDKCGELGECAAVEALVDTKGKPSAGSVIAGLLDMKFIP